MADTRIRLSEVIALTAGDLDLDVGRSGLMVVAGWTRVEMLIRYTRAGASLTPSRSSCA